MASDNARIASIVALALTTGASYASNFHPGFYIGLNSGASFVSGQTYSELTRDPNFFPSFPFGVNPTVFRDEGSTRGYNAGALVGWNFYCDREYIYGLELTGNLYTNRAHQTWWSFGTSFGQFGGTPLLNFQESWDLTYSADLTFKPGWLVNSSTELYAILGASVAQLKTELKNLSPNNNDFNSDVVTFDDQKTIWGAVLGAGIQKELCNKLSAFASYQYTYYGKHTLSDGAEGGDSSQGSNILNRTLRIDSNVFKVGLIYTF